VLARAEPSDAQQVVTRGIRIYDSSLAQDSTAREAIRDVLMRSANWDAQGEGLAEQAVLYVLPQQVIVRHQLRVVRQVVQTLRDLSLTAVPNPGNSSGDPMDDDSTRTSRRRGGF
jgi:hypothetical protein